MDPIEIEDALKGRFRARLSLAPRMFASWIVSSILVLLVAMAAGYAKKHLGLPAGPMVVGMWTGIILAFIVPARVARGAQVRWLSTLKLPLDRISYLDALDVSASEGALVVEVRFERGATVAVGEVRASGAVEMQPGAMRITSPWFGTVDAGTYGTTKHNGPLHHWFRKLADDVLVPLSRTHPMESVAVQHKRLEPVTVP